MLLPKKEIMSIAKMLEIGLDFLRQEQDKRSLWESEQDRKHRANQKRHARARRMKEQSIENRADYSRTIDNSPYDDFPFTSETEVKFVEMV